MRASHNFVAGFLSAVLCASIATADAQSNDLLREWSKTDFSRRTVDLSEIESGGPPKDGIPAIDRPRFLSVSRAQTWLKSREPVIALAIGGEARAYPIQILMFHEIVNDAVGGTPVAVTFCPLCNASMAFDRRVEGRALDFDRELKKDKISGWRWLLGAWGVGTYRQNDSVDVRYAVDGRPHVAEGLEIEPL